MNKMKIAWKKKEKRKPEIPVYDEQFYKDGYGDIAITVLLLLLVLIVALMIFYANRILAV